MTELIIDELGRVRELAHVEGTAIAIRAMGLAGIRAEKSAISVIWDVQRVEPDVLPALRKAIAEANGALPFRLNFYYGGWAAEDYDDRWAALDRLDQLVEYAEMDPPDRASKVVKQVERTANHKVQWLADLWRHTKGLLKPEGVTALNGFSSNIMALENLRFGFIGENTLMAQVCKPADIAGMIGTPYDRDPAEPPFARSVVDEYTAVATSGVPHYDHVCAPISLYGVTRWLRYERLICPFGLPDGREILTVLCESSQHIDVSFPQFQTG